MYTTVLCARLIFCVHATYIQLVQRVASTVRFVLTFVTLAFGRLPHRRIWLARSISDGERGYSELRKKTYSKIKHILYDYWHLL